MKEAHNNSNAKKYGMVIDLDKCTGCGACMVACMSENNVPFREDETDKLLSLAWLRIYKLTNGKPFPETDVCYLPRPCMHCEGSHGHSPCVSVCPATATDYDNEYRHCQPDLHAMFRMSLLYGRLPLSCSPF